MYCTPGNAITSSASPHFRTMDLSNVLIDSSVREPAKLPGMTDSLPAAQSLERTEVPPDVKTTDYGEQDTPSGAAGVPDSEVTMSEMDVSSPPVDQSVLPASIANALTRCDTSTHSILEAHTESMKGIRQRQAPSNARLEIFRQYGQVIEDIETQLWELSLDAVKTAKPELSPDSQAAEAGRLYDLAFSLASRQCTRFAEGARGFVDHFKVWIDGQVKSLKQTAETVERNGSTYLDSLLGANDRTASNMRDVYHACHDPSSTYVKTSRSLGGLLGVAAHPTYAGRLWHENAKEALRLSRSIKERDALIRRAGTLRRNLPATPSNVILTQTAGDSVVQPGQSLSQTNETILDQIKTLAAGQQELGTELLGIEDIHAKLSLYKDKVSQNIRRLLDSLVSSNQGGSNQVSETEQMTLMQCTLAIGKSRSDLSKQYVNRLKAKARNHTSYAKLVVDCANDVYSSFVNDSRSFGSSVAPLDDADVESSMAMTNSQSEVARERLDKACSYLNSYRLMKQAESACASVEGLLDLCCEVSDYDHAIQSATKRLKGLVAEVESIQSAYPNLHELALQTVGTQESGPPDSGIK
ncbi:hypothetical protein IAT40_006494 [Kwoniella sp. CBS 6097]